MLKMWIIVSFDMLRSIVCAIEDQYYIFWNDLTHLACRPPVCGYKYGADYCKCIEVARIFLKATRKIVRRGSTEISRGNCPTVCQWVKTAGCLKKFGIPDVSECKDRGDGYCGCVAEKEKWCVAGWCPLEKKPGTDCSIWQFWC